MTNMAWITYSQRMWWVLVHYYYYLKNDLLVQILTYKFIFILFYKKTDIWNGKKTKSKVQLHRKDQSCWKNSCNLWDLVLFCYSTILALNLPLWWILLFVCNFMRVSIFGAVFIVVSLCVHLTSAGPEHSKRTSTSLFQLMFLTLFLWWIFVLPCQWRLFTGQCVIMAPRFIARD